MDSNTNTKTIHLQGYGLAPAVTAEELQLGHVIVWNYGYRYIVRDIKPRGKTQLVIVEQNWNTGKCNERVLKRTRLVGLAGDL